MDGSSLPFSLRRLGALAAIVLAGLVAAAVPARAGDAPATVRWPVGGPALRTAMDLAAGHWGTVPCTGRVKIAWEDLGGGINAQSSWANDVDPYRQPSRNTECEIALNAGEEWDWPKLCTVVVHEVGHLTGHDHVDDPDDVMYYAYNLPVRECAATPAPAEGAAAAAPPTKHPDHPRSAGARAKPATAKRPPAPAKQRHAGSRSGRRTSRSRAPAAPRHTSPKR
jgi:hypothetical protein